MTPRQILFCALNGQPTPQMPVWLLFPYHRTGYYVDVRTHADYRAVHERSLEAGVIILNRRNLGVRVHSRDVSDEEEEVILPGGHARRRTMRFQKECIFSEHQITGSVGGKKLLASDDDLERFCRMPVEEDETTLAEAMERQLGPYRQEQSEFPPDCGAMMLDLGSPVNLLYHSANLEEYAIWSLTHSALVEEWLDRRMRQLDFVYRFCLDRDLADVYFLVGSELAAPPLVSRETFQRWVVPYEKRLIDLIHSYGKKIIQHFHGQIRELLPDFADMGPDGLHTIEAPPVGNCSLSEAFDLTQNRITLIGNIQYDEFRAATPLEMKRLVYDTLDEVAGRRFILSPTAGPFDPSPPATLIDNYLAFIAAGLAYRSARPIIPK